MKENNASPKKSGVKFFEVLDRATNMSVMAVRLQGGNLKERWILERVGLGFADAYTTQLTDLESGRTERDFFSWQSVSRTLFEAHKYIEDNWDNLETGGVIDIEFILGETESPKPSEFRFKG